MSSFIVEDKTINRIVSFCFWENDSILKHEIQRELKNIGVDLWELYESDKQTDDLMRCFGEELLKLNICAFYCRYSHIEDIKKEIKEAIKENKFEDLPYIERNRFQVLKSIECFLYQCAEGEIPEHSPLYKALENIANSLKSHLIDKIPEYQKAIWA